MAEAAFNPYHVWLGIPPQEQPANLYRLLAIPLLESDADVIDNAADRQTAHLRTFQSGKHGKLAEKLLNEVATARVVLLDPKKKTDYDGRIRAWLEAQKAQMAGAAASQQTAPQQAAPQPSDWDSLLGDVESKPRKSVGGRQSAVGSKQKAKQRPLAIFAVAGVLLVAAAAIGIVALNSSSGDGTLALDWPADQREGATLTIDDASVSLSAAGPIEQSAQPGEHRLAATRPLYQPWSATVTMAAGERQAIRVEWKPKAVVALDWPPKDRKGATLTFDGNLQTLSEHEPLELLTEPGNHGIRIIRPNADPFQTSVEVALGGRRTIVVPAAAAPAMLVVQWPQADRQGAQLTIDGETPLTDKSGPDAVQFALMPGRHTLRITRAGFQPFEQTIELAATGNKPLVPTWTPEVATNTQPTTPDVAVTPTPQETPAKKLPVPAAEEQAKLAKQLDELYKPAHTDADVAKANELYDLADKAQSPAEGYMLRLKGAELAAGAGDLATAFTGIDQLAAAYELEPFEAKQRLLDKAVAAANTAEQLTALVTAAEQLLDQAIAADQYDGAMAIAASASKALGKRTLDVQFRKDADELLARRRRDIHMLEPFWAAAQKAQKTLDANADDAAANLTLGRWFSFYKNDWPRGLPLLAKGSDEKVKALAQAELKPPATTDEQVQAADAWWDASPKEIAYVRDAIRLHAGDLYTAALPGLSSPLAKIKIDKRLAEIAGLHREAAPVTATGLRPADRHDFIKIVDLKPLSTEVGWGEFLVNRAGGDGDAPLITRDFKLCDEYIFAHAPSRVSYAVPPESRSFSATGYCVANRNVRFEIVCDGQSLYRSQSGGVVPIKVELPRGAQKLELVAAAAAADRANAHSFWCCPRFYSAADATGKFQRLTDMTPTAAEVGYYSLTVNSLPDPVVTPPLDAVSAVPCDEFLFAHANSRIRYEVPDGAVRFTGIGFCQRRALLTYKVVCDGAVLYESQPSGIAAIDVTIPQGAHALDLAINFNHHRDGAHSYWCYPRFYFAAKSPSPPAEPVDLKRTPTSIAAPSTAEKLSYTAAESSWKLGQPNVKLIPKNLGFCFLASVAGHFGGYGDAAGVHVANDRFWWFDAHSEHEALAAKAISIAGLTPAMFRSGVTEYHWKLGEPPVKMLHQKNGICFLSEIAGHLAGPSEQVSVRLADDGYWYLDGKSRQDQLGASAIGIQWAKPDEYSIEAEQHNWSAGDSPVKLIEKGQGFAFLSSVSGKFVGYDDEVKVHVGDGDSWYLEGKSGDKSLRATATAVRVLKVATADAANATSNAPAHLPVEPLR